MQPVTILTLLVYVPAFLLMLALYGNPFRIVFEKYLVKRNITLDRVEEVSLTLASGSAVIPLIIMILTLFGGLLTTFTVQFLTLVFTVINFVVYRKSIGRLKKAKITLPNVKTTIALVVFLAIFIFHLYPSLGLFVYPGNDPALYSLISLRIVESRGFTMSWGIFAPLTWYQEKVHLIIAGFAGECAFFHVLTGLSIEKTVTLLTRIYTASISLGVYFLVKRLFKNVGIALCSAFAFGILIQEPSMLWFSWGGNAELSSLFLLPIMIGLFWELFHNNSVGFRYLLYLAFLISGAMMFHPFSIFYLAFFLIPYSIIFIYLHRKLTPVLKSLVIFSISILFILPVLIPAAVSEMEIRQLYESYVFSPLRRPRWPIISWGRTPAKNLYAIILRFCTVYGAGSFLLLITGINMLRNHKVNKEPLILLGAWALMLFLIHENYPTGLYVIPFPLWYRVEPDRVFGTTSFPASIIMGIGIVKILNELMGDDLIKGSKIVPSLKLALKKAYKKKKVLAVLLLCLFQISLNVAILNFARGNSPVTESDIDAFNWINQKTSTDAIFFVSKGDAGYWIPIYTHRRIVIPFGVVTNITLRDQYLHKIHDAFIEDPTNLECVEFLNYHHVDYVYVGSKTIYNWENFDPNLIALEIQGPSIFTQVYNQNGTHIFKYLGNSTVTIWEDTSFLSGWNTGSGFGGTVNATTDGDHYTLGTSSGGYVYSTHNLTLNNTQNITYLVVRWRTYEDASYKIDVVVDGEHVTLMDWQKSPSWTTSTINLNNYAVGQITSLFIIVNGKGYTNTDYVGFRQLVLTQEDQ